MAIQGSKKACRPCRCPPGPSHMEDSEQRIKPTPELRPRLGPHETGEHRLTRIHGVSGEFLVEDNLEEDRHDHDPHHGGPKLDRSTGTHQPLATAD